MATYISLVRYEPQAWRTLQSNPQNQEESVSRAVQQAGGSLEAMYFTVDSDRQDAVLVLEMPNQQAVEALQIASRAAGHIQSITTLLAQTPAELQTCLQQAQQIQLQSPVGSSSSGTR